MARNRLPKPALIALMVILVLGGVGLGYYSKRRPSPALIASRFLAAWKAGDTRTAVRLSSLAPAPGLLKTSAGEFKIPDLAAKVVFIRLSTAGPQSISDDIATVPAVAQIDGGRTARAVVKAFPMDVGPSLVSALGKALDKTFAFRVGMIKEKDGWKVSQQATFTSLGDALQQDPAVKRAGIAIFQNALPGLL